MKNAIKVFAILMIVISICSCQSRENKARSAVKEYFIENLDDPKDFEEIKSGQLTRMFDRNTKKFLYYYLPYKFRVHYDGGLKVINLSVHLDSSLNVIAFPLNYEIKNYMEEQEWRYGN